MDAHMKRYAQALRRNATKEERRLWYDFLKVYPVQFRRQVVFGRYILDFYCAKAKLAVELDGSQHYQDEGPAQDAARSAYLQETYGIHVLRFTNLELQRQFEGVCQRIDMEVRRRSPSSVPCGDTFPP